MTDRIKGLTVVLDRDIRDDDVEQIVAAIMMVRGVIKVGKNVADHNDYINRERIRSEMAQKLYNALKDDKA